MGVRCHICELVVLRLEINGRGVCRIEPEVQAQDGRLWSRRHWLGHPHRLVRIRVTIHRQRVHLLVIDVVVGGRDNHTGLV